MSVRLRFRLRARLVDPGAVWFPHLYGYADETGSGPGEGRQEGTADEAWAAGGLTGDTGCTALGVPLPAVVVQEGAYHLPSRGTLVAAYLEGHETAP